MDYFINADWEFGRSLIHFAVGFDNFRLVKQCIQLNADVNKIGNFGRTALFSCRSLEIAKYLVDNGADVNILNHGGETAVVSLYNGGDTDIIKYLAGITNLDIECGQYNPSTLLHKMISYEEKDLSLFKIVIPRTKNINRITNYSRSYLMNAVLNNKYLDVIKILIEFGAFDYCDNISTLKIPPSVKSIGSMALSCGGLTALYAYPVIPVDVNLSIGVFNNLNITQCSLYVPFGSLAAYQDAWGWQYFSPIVEMNGFALSDTAVSISYVEGSIASDSLTANIIWIATSDKTWLTVSPNMATTGNATLTFTAGVNTGEARKATVTVSSEDVAYPQIITIYQQSGGSTSVSEVKENSNSIYPNPSHGLVNVCFYIPEPSRVRIDVLNLCGGDVLLPYISSKSSGENIVKFDLSRLPAGYYFVRILTKSGTQLRKLIIQ